MNSNLRNRDEIIQALKRELVGPSPAGEEIDCSSGVVLSDEKQAYLPHKEKTTGEEILQRDRPTKRYGVGVLYPFMAIDVDESSIPEAGLEPQDAAPVKATEDFRPRSEEPVVMAEAEKDIAAIVSRNESLSSDDEGGELDLSSANTYKPSSMAVSFVASLDTVDSLVVEAVGGRYRKLEVKAGLKTHSWWLRSPVQLTARYSSLALRSNNHGQIAQGPPQTTNTEGLDVQIEVFSRPSPDDNGQLLTVCLVNRKPAASSLDEISLFQARFSAFFEANGVRVPCIRAYPGGATEFPDDEEQSIDLLYRSVETYGIGHGCAADWECAPKDELASAITAESLPVFETPSVTPDIRRNDGTSIDVSMLDLAGLSPGQDGMDSLDEVITGYETWITECEKQIDFLQLAHQITATAHMDQCKSAAARMRTGISFLRSDPQAFEAFRLANHAVLLQQIRTRRDVRTVGYDPAVKRYTFSSPYPEVDASAVPPGRGTWRPFQIAFLLMSLESTADASDQNREVVELIWFPTGGGKTEAYLGLSAFSIFLRRLRDQDDVGVDVIMRYTLRLLTAQQFQRAGGLVCAMEYLRRQRANLLGESEISIGIWVGGGTTPNSRADALAALNKLRRNASKAENPFLITKCPWCGSQMGPLDLPARLPSTIPRMLGYERRGSSVVYRCSDSRCDFANELPIYSIDEDIYERRPSLVIGTVDKFAMLAWRPEAKTLFGLDSGGHRIASPPTVIVQDELHLISGPLGTMVGLFEVVVEELCTDYRRGVAKPKIISSTATIRRYVEQVRSLYGRANVALFPPPGLEASDSYFAQYARFPDGSLQPGRKYVGVHAPGLGSLQTTQVRTFTSLLQAAMSLPDQEKDPWWTLLTFFNSLRELGTTLSLFQSDIPDYLRAVKGRADSTEKIRRLRHITELTGRLTSEQIPDAISALEAAYNGSPAGTLDVCLASNIIEVGIDIDRLSLMSVVGQPKTTSQYIQVTGRVGRKWHERPGLVVTLYGASKPRDRSHFEKFRSYHERLYAQVEPTSVTPFSPPALDRGLHAVMAAYIRQLGNSHEANSPFPMPTERLETLAGIMRNRILMVDPDEEAEFLDLFSQRMGEWDRWERTLWSSYAQNGDQPLLRVAGAYCSPELKRLSWPTQQSMRNVDAECQVEITTLYIDGGSDNA